MTGCHQVRQDDVILILAGTVIGDGNHGHTADSFDLSCHGLGNQGGTAKSGIGLDKQGKVWVVFEDMEYFQQVII